MTLPMKASLAKQSFFEVGDESFLPVNEKSKGYDAKNDSVHKDWLKIRCQDYNEAIE